VRFTPSEVQGPTTAAPPGSPRSALPLVKVRCPSERSYATGSRGTSVPRSHLGLGRFRRALWFLSDRRPPQTCVYGFILPRAFRLLQSATATDLPFVPRKTLRPSGSRRAPPLGFASLFAAPTGGVHYCPGSHSRTDVPSSAFLTPSTVCSATGLRGFISPRSHVQGSPSRGLSLSAEPYGVSPADALVPLSEGTCQEV